MGHAPLGARLASRADARREPSPSPGVTPIYTAGILLVLAQLIGIYGLVTRKADLVFALVMGALLVLAVVLGGYGVYHKLH